MRTARRIAALMIAVPGVIVLFLGLGIGLPLVFLADALDPVEEVATWKSARSGS